MYPRVFTGKYNFNFHTAFKSKRKDKFNESVDEDDSVIEVHDVSCSAYSAQAVFQQ